MSNLVIGDYTTAITIDGSTHYLLIQPGGSSTAYKKINRNVFLGVTGQPMDISTAQNVTNKTLDNSNIATLRDDRFTLQDNADTTKQAQFQLSGITTATTRTYTLPNRSDTLVDLGSTQTLTSKTLTSPVINNGSITGTTITTDAIVGQSASTSGTVYGLPVTSSKVGSNGVITASITDGAVTPAKLTSGLGASWTWQSWTPTWTNLTVSGSTVTARYSQVGKTVFFRVAVVLANGNVPSGSISFTLPVTAASYAGTATLPPIGQAVYFDAGTASYDGFISFNSTTTAVLYVMAANGTYATTTSLSSTVPFTWGNTDEFLLQGYYEAA
jgi:hypothetical protein